MNKSTLLEGHHLVSPATRFAIVVSRFNEVVCERLLDGALDILRRHGAKSEDICVARVPGAFEIPLAARRLARSKKFDAVIVLGAVIRGGTPHFDYICSAVTSGINQVMMETDTPISFGLLTTENSEQALERAGMKMGNKGVEAALAAVEMVNLLKQVENHVR